MLYIKILFLTAFCVINTNAVLDKGIANTCMSIMEDPNFAFTDLQIIECNFVTISDIKLTDHGMVFQLHDPKYPFPDYIFLNKTEQMLFNGSTKIFFAEKGNEDDGDDWNIVKVQTLGKYLQGFNEVKLYHNYNRRASIMYYRKDSSYIVEGNIGTRLLRYISHNDYNGDETTYVYAKIGPLNTDELRRELYLDPYKQEFYNLKSSTLERVHINLLPIIDGRILNYGIIDQRTILRPILSYYNYIDMLFGVFSSPIISFTIKGIVIPKTAQLLPYVDNSNSVATAIYLSNVHNGLVKFMANQKNYFELNSYDIVIFMAGRRIFDDVSVSDGSIASTTFFKHSVCETSIYPLAMISVYSDYIHDYLLWHLISKFGTTKRIKHELQHCRGFPETYVRMNGRKHSYLPWMDKCVADMITDYFKHHDCSYFKN